VPLLAASSAGEPAAAPGLEAGSDDPAAAQPFDSDGAATVGASRRVPHELQNLEPGGFVALQVGHGLARRVPHALQKRAPATFSVAQLGQITQAPRST
jgi:hypothetical protein